MTDAGDSKTRLIDLFIAVLVGFAVTLLWLALAAVVMTFAPISETWLSVFSILGTLWGVMVSGGRAVHSVSSKGWLHGGVAGIVYGMIFYLVSCLAKHSVTFAPSVMFLLLLSFLGGAVGGIFAINRKSSKKRK